MTGNFGLRRVIQLLAALLKVWLAFSSPLGEDLKGVRRKRTERDKTLNPENALITSIPSKVTIREFSPEYHRSFEPHVGLRGKGGLLVHNQNCEWVSLFYTLRDSLLAGFGRNQWGCK